MYTREDIVSYRCPRWETWPGIDLYMDQVISILEESVQLFYTEALAKPVTATMINNYVKQKIITPSKNKKYQKEHLAYLYILFLLKPVVSLPDICAVLSYLQTLPDAAKAYAMFGYEIERALALAFGGAWEERDGEGAPEILRPIALSFAYTLLARTHLAEFEKKKKEKPADKTNKGPHPKS